MQTASVTDNPSRQIPWGMISFLSAAIPGVGFALSALVLSPDGVGATVMTIFALLWAVGSVTAIILGRIGQRKIGVGRSRDRQLAQVGIYFGVFFIAVVGFFIAWVLVSHAPA